MNEKICPKCLKIFDNNEQMCPLCNEVLEDYFKYYLYLESRLKSALSQHPSSKLKVKQTLNYYISLRDSFNQFNDKQFVIRTFQKIITNLKVTC